MKKHLLITLSILISFIGILNNNVYAVVDNNLDLSYDREQLEISTDSTYGKARWYYRMVNGREQKRLWSYTSGEWLTEWQWV